MFIIAADSSGAAIDTIRSFDQNRDILDTASGSSADFSSETRVGSRWELVLNGSDDTLVLSGVSDRDRDGLISDDLILI